MLLCPWDSPGKNIGVGCHSLLQGYLPDPEIEPGSSPIAGFHGGSDSKESACSAGDSGSIPGSGRSPGEGNGYPLFWTKGLNQTLKVNPKLIQGILTLTSHYVSQHNSRNNTHSKCNTLESSPNHPPLPQPVEKLCSMKLVSGARTVEDHCCTSF